MRLFNKKGGWQISDYMMAPFLLIILVMVIGFVIYFFTDFNQAIQDDTNIGALPKSVSQEALDQNIEGMGLLVPVFLLVMILWTLGGAYFIADFQNWFFLLGIVILIFYTIVMGVIVTFFDFLMEQYIFDYAVSYMPFISHYFQWFFIYQTAWFVVMWVLYSLGGARNE